MIFLLVMEFQNRFNLSNFWIISVQTFMSYLQETTGICFSFINYQAHVSLLQIDNDTVDFFLPSSTQHTATCIGSMYSLYSHLFTHLPAASLGIRSPLQTSLVPPGACTFCNLLLDNILFFSSIGHYLVHANLMFQDIKIFYIFPVTILYTPVFDLFDLPIFPYLNFTSFISVY